MNFPQSSSEACTVPAGPRDGTSLFKIAWARGESTIESSGPLSDWIARSCRSSSDADRREADRARLAGLDYQGSIPRPRANERRRDERGVQPDRFFSQSGLQRVD